MPELPEVETIRRGLARAMEGRRIENVEVRRSDLRLPVPVNFSERLKGRTLEKLGRRAKYLVGEFDDGTILLAHFGMSGRMMIDTTDDGNHIENANNSINVQKKHEHIVFYLGNGTVIRFCDPRRFGLMVLTDRNKIRNHKLIRHLGPEPTNKDFTGDILANALKGRKTPIKTALLDQQVVAGIGNIYASEALFEARISPRRAATNIQGQRAHRLAQSIRKVLIKAIDAGGSSINDHVAPSGELGYFQHFFNVYDRVGQSCLRPECGKKVRRINQSGRSTFYCGGCQR